MFTECTPSVWSLMNWPAYHYLVFVLLAALVVAAVLAKLMPRLSESQNRPHRTPAEIAMLVAILALGLATLYTNFYRGLLGFGWWDVGSDTLQQYVPYYLNLVESLRQGTLGFFNFEYGLGTTFMSYQSWTLDPFNLIVLPICLVWGSSKLSLALVVAQSAKIVLAGLLFDHLLVHYCRTPIARILGSALYAFCGYLLLWGQHYWLGGICVICVALLVALEELMVRWSLPRFLCVMLLSALSIIMSTYSGFMVMLFAASYALVRVAVVSGCRSFGEYLRAYASLAVPAICGVLLSCITLVPYALLMLGESSRVTGGDASLVERATGYLRSFVSTTWIMPILSRLMGNSLISSGEPIPPEVIPTSNTLHIVNVFEFMSLGLSCGVIVLVLQYLHWLLTEARARVKVTSGIGLVFCLMYCLNAFLPALNNVFAEAKYRSSFTVCILICIAMAVAFEQRSVLRAPNLPLLWIGGIVSVAVAAWSLVKTVNGRLECVAFVAAAALAAVTLALWEDDPKREIALALTCLVLVGSSVLDGFFTTNRRVVSSIEDFPMATEPNKADDTAEALAYLRNLDQSFYRVDKIDYFDWCTYEDSLVQGYPTMTSYNSTLDSDVEELYEKLWPAIYNGDTAYQQFQNDVNRPEMARVLGIRYLLSYDGASYPWLEEITQCGHIHVYRNKGEASVLTLWNKTVTEDVADAAESVEARAAIVGESLVVPAGSAGAGVDSTAAGTPKTPEVQRVGQVLSATAAIDQDCVACLAVPYSSGWKVSVDGKAAKTFRANYGLVGFVLAPGTHKIEARFVPRGMVIGAGIAVTGVVLAVVACISRKRHNQMSGGHFSV